MADEITRPEMFDVFVAECLKAGHHPDYIEYWIEDALFEHATDYRKEGTGHWGLDTVCPICGDPWAGICGHFGMYEGGPILRKDFTPDPSVDVDIVLCRGCKRRVRRESATLSFRGYRCPDCEQEPQP